MTSTESATDPIMRLTSLSPSPVSDDPNVARTLLFLTSIFRAYPKSDFRFRLWDGTEWEPINPTTPVSFTVILNHAASLRRMFFPPSDTRLGMAYTLGDFDITGDMASALDLGRHLWETWGVLDTLRNIYLLLRLPASPIATIQDESKHTAELSGVVHSEQRDMSAIQYHYDVSNEFYMFWLDKRMVYSCAYFTQKDNSIDEAQFAKLDIICKKLRLKQGDTLLDIGCGWGALAIHAAKYYGARVTGVTLSEKQVSLAVKRVEEEGLSLGTDVDIQLMDYRRVAGTFDKIVSVGMVEHVGRENLHEYFTQCYNLLKPGGVFLNHGIALLHDQFKTVKQMRRGFFAKYIFPDGDLQPLPYILQWACDVGWEIRDVEGLREHYMLTLKQWFERFVEREKDITDVVDAQTFRLWKLYLVGAMWGFKVGLHTIYQTLLYKKNEAENGCAINDLPLVRNDWYASAQEDEHEKMEDEKGKGDAEENGVDKVE